MFNERRNSCLPETTAQAQEDEDPDRADSL
jgi:hypothetical protein